MYSHYRNVRFLLTCSIVSYLCLGVESAPTSPHGKQPRRPFMPTKILAEYLTRARVTGSGPKLRSEELDGKARLFEWLDALIFGSPNAPKQPYHSGGHNNHHSHDEYYDDYHYEDHDCHHHHDYDDYNTKFQASNGQNGQNVYAPPRVQVIPLTMEGLKPYMNSGPAPAVTIPNLGPGFPFSKKREEISKVVNI